MSPHWWPEGCRLLAASVPHILRGRRQVALTVVTLGSAMLAAGIWFVAVGVTGGTPSDELIGSTVSGVIGAGLGAMVCLLVFQHRDRPRSFVDGYIPESQEAPLREAFRVGDFTGVPIDVRHHLVAKAVQSRDAVPLALLPELVFVGMCLLVSPVLFLLSDAVTPAVLIGVGALLRCGTALTLLNYLGRSTATLDAEARAVARVAERSAR